MSAKLIPPDRKRCQGEQREGSFMTLGPRALVRCLKAPVVIATETKPGEDGRRGSMSLCAECQSVLTQLRGRSFATFRPMRKRRAAQPEKEER